MREDVISIVGDPDPGDIMRCAIFCDKFKGERGGMGMAEGVREDEIAKPYLVGARVWAEAALSVLTMSGRRVLTVMTRWRASSPWMRGYAWMKSGLYSCVATLLGERSPARQARVTPTRA